MPGCRVGRAGRFGTRGLAVTLLEGPAQLARLQSYLREVAGGQVRRDGDTVLFTKQLFMMRRCCCCKICRRAFSPPCHDS